MWVLLGVCIGYLVFGNWGIRGGGIILTNSKNEFLLLQSTESGQWGFPKGPYKHEDMAYYFTAIREMEEETTLQAYTHYDILPGGCRYGNKIYYYGALNEGIDTSAVKVNTLLENGPRNMGWFSRAALPDSMDRDILDWMSAGMPSACHIHEEL